VLAIPSAAVHSEAGVPLVYTLEDGKIARYDVTLGDQVEGSEFIEVRSGLKQGQRVIVASIGDRKPGDPAMVRGEDAAVERAAD
jgi:multidrug efflux pump subunit AcrA (membrane-fusion protein)